MIFLHSPHLSFTRERTGPQPGLGSWSCASARVYLETRTLRHSLPRKSTTMEKLGNSEKEEPSYLLVLPSFCLLLSSPTRLLLRLVRLLLVFLLRPQRLLPT